MADYRNKGDLVNNPKNPVGENDYSPPDYRTKPDMKGVQFEKNIQVGDSGLGDSQWDSNTPFEALENLNAQRAQLQPWTDQFANMLGQAVLGEVVGGTLEGFGYLLDFEGMANMITGKEKEYNNWLSEFGQGLRETGQENLAIYEERPGEMNMSDPGYWFKNGVSVASSLSMLLPSMAAGKALKFLGKGISRGMGAIHKGADLSAKMGVQASWMADGITQAISSRHIENSMEAVGTFKDQKEKMINEINPKTGVNFTTEEAKQYAAESAAYNYRHGWAMLAQDIPQYLALGRVFNPNTMKMEGALSRAAGAGKSPKWLSKTKAVGGTFVSEGAEEGYQHYIAEKSKLLSDLKAGLIDEEEFEKELSETMGSDAAKTSMLFGGLGGNLFQLAGKGVNHAFKSKDRKEREDKMAETYKTNLSLRAKQIQAGQIMLAKADQTGDEDFRRASLNSMMAQTIIEAIDNNKLDEAIEQITATTKATPEEIKAFEEEHGIEFNPDLAKKHAPEVLEMAQKIRKMHFKNLGSAANKKVDKTNISNITMKQFLSQEAATAIKDINKKYEDTLESSPITARNKGTYVDKMARLNVTKDAIQNVIDYNIRKAAGTKNERLIDRYEKRAKALEDDLRVNAKDIADLESTKEKRTKKEVREEVAAKTAHENIHDNLVGLKAESMKLDQMIQNNEDDISYLRTPAHERKYKELTQEEAIKKMTSEEEVDQALASIEKEEDSEQKEQVVEALNNRKKQVRSNRLARERRVQKKLIAQQQKDKVKKKNQDPKVPDNNVEEDVENLEDENVNDEVDFGEQLELNFEEVIEKKTKSKTISPLDNPFNDKKNAFKEWKYNGKPKVGTKITYEVSTSGAHMSSGGANRPDARAVRAFKLAKASKKPIPPEVYENLPIKVLIGDGEMKDGKRVHSIFTFLEPKPLENVGKKRMSDYEANSKEERIKIIDALYRGETPTSQIDYTSGGELMTESEEVGRVAENNIKDLEQVQRSKDGPHLVYTDLKGRLMEMDKTTPNKEFFGKLLDVGENEDGTKKPYRGGLFLILDKADGTPFPVRLNFLKNTEIQGEILADILMDVVVPVKGQKKALKYSSPLSFASDSIQERVKEHFGPELKLLGKDPRISDIVDMFVYVSNKTEGMTSELYFSGNHIVYGGGKRITPENRDDAQAIEEFVDFLTNHKRRQLSLNKWNNLKGYKDYALDNRIINTNVVVGGPEFDSNPKTGRRIQMYIGLLDNKTPDVQPKSSKVVTPTNNLLAGEGAAGEGAGLSPAAIKTLKDKKEAEVARELEELQGKQDTYGSNPRYIILNNMPKITPESAAKETGGKVGTKQDINPSWLAKDGVSVEVAAGDIVGTDELQLDEAQIRDEIIDILSYNKSDLMEEITGEKRYKELKAQQSKARKSAQKVVPSQPAKSRKTISLSGLAKKKASKPGKVKPAADSNIETGTLKTDAKGKTKRDC